MGGEASRINGRLGGKPKHRSTIEREELLRQFRARVAAEFPQLTDALFTAARGVTHLMAKDRDGTWTEVTDPHQMLRVLNSGEQFYKLSARNPEIRALKEIFDRTFGLPKQELDVHVSGDLELIARLTKARKRVKVVDVTSSRLVDATRSIDTTPVRDASLPDVPEGSKENTPS